MSGISHTHEPPSSSKAPPDKRSATPQPPALARSKSANGTTVSNGPIPVPLSARRSDRLNPDSVERKGKRPRPPASRKHTGDVRDAQTFRPSEEQWKNPMAYIRSISEEGSRYGIVKIIPPDSWNPELAIDTERFHFKTRKQELNSVEGVNRASSNYIEQLTKYHKQFKHGPMRAPSVDKKPLDLYELKKAVQARGGFEKVCERKKWAEVGRALGYSGKIMSSLSTSLKHSYERWLNDYEQWLAGVKPGVQMQIDRERGGPLGTPSPGASPFSPMKRSQPPTPSSLSRVTPAFQASQALQMSIGGRDTQSQPPEASWTAPHPGGFHAVNAHGSFPAPPVPTYPPSTSSAFANGFPPPPDSRLMHERPASSSFSSATKPMFPGLKNYSNGASYGSFELKRSYSDVIEDDRNRTGAEGTPTKRPKLDPLPTVTGSHMAGHRFPNLAASFKAATNGQSSDSCEVCKKSNDSRNMVICETCDHGYHRQCHDPPVDRVTTEWHCSRCLVGTGEYGFGEGSIYSLKQFQTKANDFKENYFKGRTVYDPITDKETIPEDEVEKEFWRLVATPIESVEVEYGADLHSAIHGSGFPTIERNPRDPMSIDPWNLNVLPLHQESLLKYIKSDISGMTVPWLYVGMCFSTFCWHVEDHYAYSANYQHLGATKTWYGIPASDAVKFEAVMKARMPDLLEAQPDLLDQLTTLLNPGSLKEAGVTVYAVDQRAGEFVVTFPQAFHCGFNHGFNLNEAVNFAPADWEPFGRAGVERRRQFHKLPCFSHDDLLFTAASAKDVPIKTAKWLAPALESIADREIHVRSYFEQRVEDPNLFKPSDDDDTVMQFERQTDHEDLPPEREEEYACSYCKAFSYLSRFTCDKTNKVACLDHIAMVDWTPGDTGNRFVLHTKLTTTKLEQLVQKIKDTATRPDAWLERFHSATDGISKPSLKTMRSLVAEGERLPWPLKELGTLKKSVEACNEWVEEAISFIARKQQNRRKNEKAWRKSSQAKGSDTDDKDKEYRKISNIKRLLTRAEKLAFDCQEITTLQEKLNTVKDYQYNVKHALSNLSNMTTEEIDSLITEGKSFGVDIPEINTLEKIVQQMRWLDNAKDAREYSTSKGVDSLLEEGLRLEVPPDHERIGFLRQHKHAGETLQLKITEWLSKQETINLAQLETYYKTAATLPVSEEVIAEMNSLLVDHRAAQKRIQDVVAGTRNPDRSKRPTYKAMKDCQDSVTPMSPKPEGWLELDKLQKKQEDWMRRGKKLFGKSNAPLPILHQHLKIIDERNKACLDTTEKPRAPVEPSSREHTPIVDYMDNDAREVYCLCRRPEDGMMIECKVCHEWYHSKCLKIARGKYKEEDEFTCPVCDHRIKIPRDAIRPKLEEMEHWQNELAGIPFVPEEAETLQSIVDVANSFRGFIQSFMANPMLTTMEEVPTLRFYLRKIEGADILLTEETNYFRQELYRMVPIAPEAPPIMTYSLSTRKPRPTKEQKLMKEHGVSKPEDLPSHLRAKPPGKAKKVGEKVKDESSPSADPAATSQIQFKNPLTAKAFPPKAHKDTPLSKIVASLPSTPMNPFMSQSNQHNAAGSAGTPSVDSPMAFGSTGAEDSPQQECEDASNIDPTLFSGQVDFGADDEAGEDHDANIFDQGDSHEPMNSNFDSMFADLTNDDDIKDEPLGGNETGLDPSLMT